MNAKVITRLKNCLKLYARVNNGTVASYSLAT